MIPIPRDVISNCILPYLMEPTSASYYEERAVFQLNAEMEDIEAEYIVKSEQLFSEVIKEARGDIEKIPDRFKAKAHLVHTVDVSGIPMTGELIAKIRNHCPHVQKLDLTRSRPDDACLKELVQCKELKILKLENKIYGVH